MTPSHPLNDGHIHEAIDRLHVAVQYLEATLAEHALIAAVPALAAEVDAAIDRLAALYQTIGQHDQVAALLRHYGVSQRDGTR
jgi:hypothetical protein